MKSYALLTVLFLFVGLTHDAAASQFKLESQQLSPGQQLVAAQVYNGFGCTGKNISPDLRWKGAPAGTKSFAVTVYDPDAPTGSGWWHWLIFNIPAKTNRLVENAGNPKAHLAPAGSIQSRTDFGAPGFGGACPPKGDPPHHYRFTVYALDTEKLPLDINAPGAMVGFYINSHKLAEASIIMTYKR